MELKHSCIYPLFDPVEDSCAACEDLKTKAEAAARKNQHEYLIAKGEFDKEIKALVRLVNETHSEALMVAIRKSRNNPSHQKAFKQMYHTVQRLLAMKGEEKYDTFWKPPNFRKLWFTR